MRFNYITIEREYGSGGTEIAHRLAKACGIPCYGMEILEAVSKEWNVPIDRIEKYEENSTGSFLYSMYALSRSGGGESDLLSLEGRVFVEEQKVIQKMAASGRAIFLGHCASEALKYQKDVINIFIRCSDEKAKKERIGKEYGIEESQIDATRKRFDKKRSTYYRANTGRQWASFTGYDIVLDSGRLGIDGCVDILKNLFNN